MMTSVQVVETSVNIITVLLRATLTRMITLQATYIHGSLYNCENEPLGVKWKTCLKFLGIYITYDVQILVEKNFKQRLKKIKNTINLWKSRVSIHGKVNIIKTLLFPIMIYPSSVLCTPFEVIKEFNSLVFRFFRTVTTRLSDFQRMHLMTKVASKC